MKITLTVLAVFAVIASIGYGFALSRPHYPPVVVTQVRELDPISAMPDPASSGASPTSTAVRELPSGFREFRSQPFHFSILYPNDLEARQESDYDGEAFTAVLFNQAKGEALQIYVQPYTLPTVTPARFKLDAPYTKTTDPINVEVQGAKGLEFVGSSAGNPDMLEIWFIHEGLLYEVTAPASLKNWAEGMLNTWMFVP